MRRKKERTTRSMWTWRNSKGQNGVCLWLCCSCTGRDVVITIPEGEKKNQFFFFFNIFNIRIIVIIINFLIWNFLDEKLWFQRSCLFLFFFYKNNNNKSFLRVCVLKLQDFLGGERWLSNVFNALTFTVERKGKKTMRGANELRIDRDTKMPSPPGKSFQWVAWYRVKLSTGRSRTRHTHVMMKFGRRRACIHK